MEDIDNRLMEQIKYLIELEVRKLLVENARFNRIVLNDYDKRLKAFEEEIDAKISFYGESKEKYADKKQELLDTYKAEFDKVYQKRKSQFFGIQAEIQEIQANQKVAIANFKKFEEFKIVYAKSEDYVKFIERRDQLQYMIEQAQTIDEANTIQQKLNSMQNPLDNFDGKLSALVEKYNEYDLLVYECEKKLEECIDATLVDFEHISLKQENAVVKVTASNKFISFINTLINFVTGGNKFEKQVILKYHSKLKELSYISNTSQKSIDSQTISLMSTISKLREDINEEFMRNAG